MPKNHNQRIKESQSKIHKTGGFDVADGTSRCGQDIEFRPHFSYKFTTH